MIIHNGKEYARVSDILKPFCNFSGIDEEVLKNKADIGIRVHEAIADDIQGEFPTLFEEREIGYFKSFLKWKKQISPHFLFSEQRFFEDEKMISGAIDTLIRLPKESDPILVDFKTSSQESPIIWPMQAHLYCYLLAQNSIQVGLRFLFIKLDRWGNDPIVFEYKFSKNTFSKCMSSIDLFWKNKQSENNLFS